MKAPLFELPMINGTGIFRLEEQIGRIIVITFWTSWCPDCGLDLPKKEQLYKSIADRVDMITINVTGRERTLEDAKKYTDKFLSQTTLADRGKEVYDLYQCNGVPTTIIIDKKGKIHDTFGDKANFLNVMESIGQLLLSSNK